jgi:hypothetical protein
MFRIIGREESALVMIEPPGEQRRTRILEIDDDIFVAIERAIFEGLRRLVRHARVEKFCVRVDAFAEKASKYGGGGSSVKASVVETDTDFQIFSPLIS